MWPLAVAELTLGAQQIAGTGIAGVLATMATLIARRTKDTDEAREHITQLALDHALEREGKAQAEIDAARAEARSERARAERLAEQNAELRETNAGLRASLRGEPAHDLHRPA